jgi:hypothetical protein
MAMAYGGIHRRWLITQFERLADENDDFDYSENWKALCVNEQGNEDVYEVLYLWRLLWSNMVVG